MSRRRSSHRAFHACLGIVIGVFACLESASGRIAAAALGERDHRVEIRLADGHLDLVLRHGGAPADEPIDRDHVVHLCDPAEAIASPRSLVPPIDWGIPPTPMIAPRRAAPRTPLSLEPLSRAMASALQRSTILLL